MEKTLRREVELTNALLQDDSSEDRQMEEMLSAVEAELRRRVAELRGRRRERKEKFLQLLETIVEKCRQGQGEEGEEGEEGL